MGGIYCNDDDLESISLWCVCCCCSVWIHLPANFLSIEVNTNECHVYESFSFSSRLQMMITSNTPFQFGPLSLYLCNIFSSFHIAARNYTAKGYERKSQSTFNCACGRPAYIQTLSWWCSLHNFFFAWWNLFYSCNLYNFFLSLSLFGSRRVRKVLPSRTLLGGLHPKNVYYIINYIHVCHISRNIYLLYKVRDVCFFFK